MFRKHEKTFALAGNPSIFGRKEGKSVGAGVVCYARGWFANELAHTASDKRVIARFGSAVANTAARKFGPGLVF